MFLLGSCSDPESGTAVDDAPPPEAEKSSTEPSREPAGDPPPPTEPPPPPQEESAPEPEPAVEEPPAEPPRPAPATEPALSEPPEEPGAIPEPAEAEAPKPRIQIRGMPRKQPAPPPSEEDPAPEEYHTVDVYYGTDRKPTAADTPSNRYGKARHREGPMEYGRTTISIPKDHRMGIVERPKWYKLEFSEDPEKHVVILELEKMDGATFFAQVGATAGETRLNEALLFVHGFNVSFDEAVRRTGQIAFDLDFGGVALSYSWPSQGALGAYTVDEGNAMWSVPHLSQFLMDLQERTDIGKIHVIAHSMGTRVLTYALANARDEGFDLDLNNVILAAPDIDADIFKDQILPKITEASDTLTMYASSEDAALKVSRSIHGNSRLGLSGEETMTVLEGMDTVDASGIDTSMLGHNYYGSHKVVVGDIFSIIIEGLKPPQRKLVPGPLGEWDFADLIP